MVVQNFDAEVRVKRDGCDDILTFSEGVAVSPRAILGRYFYGEALNMVVTHGSVVSGLSLKIGRALDLSMDELAFLGQAAMLHDIGICHVHAPGIYLFGSHPYIMHGILGRVILEAEGFPRHALVCERHIGVGLTEVDIVEQGLPLPLRDMAPRNLAEEIVCFADLFFSKKKGALEKMKSAAGVREKLAPFGGDKLQIFDRWMERFGSVLDGTSCELC
jgi:uncharacterized protein